jgi:anionic cell wall polymer biosynthesis LytR-Cps2A-Psr (LCP) family protein
VVAQALQDDFGFNTDQYMTMNQPVFGEMIGSLDGIKVDAGAPVGCYGDMGPFEQGLQEMESQAALDYEGILEPGPPASAEVARFNGQNEVVQGNYDGLLDPENMLKLPSLVGDFYHLLVTDLQPKELRSLSCMLTEQEATIRPKEVTGEKIAGTEPATASVPDTEVISAPIDELEAWNPQVSE